MGERVSAGEVDEINLQWWVLWYSNCVQWGGDQKICDKVCATNGRMAPNKLKWLCHGFPEEVSEQNHGYQISKYHPRLCPKSFPSSFQSQTQIR